MHAWAISPKPRGDDFPFLRSLLIFRHFANQLMHEIISLSDEKRSAAWTAERKSRSHKNKAAVYMHMFDMTFKPRSGLISCSDNPEINPGTLLCEFVCAPAFSLCAVALAKWRLIYSTWHRAKHPDKSPHSNAVIRMQIDFYIVSTFADIVFDLDFHSWQQWKCKISDTKIVVFKKMENDDFPRNEIIFFSNGDTNLISQPKCSFGQFHSIAVKKSQNRS